LDELESVRHSVSYSTSPDIRLHPCMPCAAVRDKATILVSRFRFSPTPAALSDANFEIQEALERLRINPDRSADHRSW